MKNILSSKILVKGAQGHLTRDSNGSFVTPKIIINGLRDDGEPFGQIETCVRGATTDGGSITPVWSFALPFGQVSKIIYDDVKFHGVKGVYNRFSYLDYEDPMQKDELRRIEITRSFLKEPWVEEFSIQIRNEIEKAISQGYKTENFPYKRRFICHIPTLSQIDAVWDKILELKPVYFETSDDGRLYYETKNSEEKLPLNFL